MFQTLRRVFNFDACRWFWKHCGVPRDGLYSDLVDMRSWLSLELPQWMILADPRFAAEELKRDRDIVLTAVRRSGLCLERLRFQKGCRF